MGQIKIHFGTRITRKHEWEQFIEIYQILKENLSDFSGTIRLVHGLKIEGVEFDNILFTKSGIYILETKAMSGTIEGGENKGWKLLEKGVVIRKFGRNLYNQIFGQNEKLKRFLKSKSISLGSRDERKQREWALDHIKAFGYFNDPCVFNATLQRETKQWFCLVTKNSMMVNLRNYTIAHEYTETELEIFVSALDLGEVIEDEPRIDTRDLGITSKTKLKELERVYELQLQQLTNEWIAQDQVINTLSIHSMSTQSEVQFTKAKALDTKKEVTTNYAAQRNQENVIDLIDELRNKEIFFSWVIGKPGSGKSSYTKQLFKLLIAVFTNTKNKRFPILIHAKNIKSDHNFINYDLDFNDEFTPFLSKLEKEGRLVFIVDALDEAYLENHIFILNFLKQQLKYKNSVLITSRWIERDLYDEIEKFISDTKDEISNKDQDHYEIQPLETDQLQHYIDQRLPNLTLNEAANIINQIDKAEIDRIPLWIDLMIDYWKEIETRKSSISEIKLLAHWVESSKKKKSDLSSILDKSEKVAFYSINSRFNIGITQSWIIAKSNNNVFEILREIGWIVPSGHYNGEKIYSFVHYRLHEYLASRYLWKNWEDLENEIFDPFKGLLSQINKETIIELSFQDAMRVDPEIKDKLVERIIKIGFANYPNNEENSFTDLRDPLLAIYLWAIIGKPRNKKIIILTDYIRHFIEYYFSDTQNKGVRHWFPQIKVLRALYVNNLSLLLIHRDSNLWGRDFRDLKLPSNLIIQILDKLFKQVDDVNTDQNYEILYLITNFYPNPRKYLEEFVELLEQPDIKEKFFRAILHLISGIDKAKAVSIALDNFKSDNKDQIERVSYYFSDLFENFEFDEFIPYLLDISDQELRRKYLDRIIGYGYIHSSSRAIEFIL